MLLISLRWFAVTRDASGRSLRWGPRRRHAHALGPYSSVRSTPHRAFSRQSPHSRWSVSVDTCRCFVITVWDKPPRFGWRTVIRCRRTPWPTPTETRTLETTVPWWVLTTTYLHVYILYVYCIVPAFDASYIITDYWYFKELAYYLS